MFSFYDKKKLLISRAKMAMKHLVQEVVHIISDLSLSREFSKKFSFGTFYIISGLYYVAEFRNELAYLSSNLVCRKNNIPLVLLGFERRK